MKTYENALRHYNNCQAPTKRAKKWLRMPDNARYLTRSGDTHKSIHKTNDGTIYYRLYNTDIATFYPADEQGHYKVVMNYYNSQTTDNFMHRFGLHYSYNIQTTTGDTVVIPQVPARGDFDHSAVLFFDEDWRLVKERSKHRDIYTYKSSDEDKAKRKVFKEKLDTLITLACINIGQYKENVTIDRDLGAPFMTSYDLPKPISEFQAFIRTYGCWDLDKEVSNPEFVSKFMSMAQSVFDILASNKIDREHGRNGVYLWKGWRDAPDVLADKEEKRWDIAQAVTVDEFKKSLVNRLMNIYGIKIATKSVAWGQFMPSIPRMYHLL